MAALAALAAIDRSRPVIILWLTGTGDNGAEKEFFEAARRRYGDRASIVKVGYPARYDYRASVATGMLALTQVLQGVAALGGRSKFRVLVAGESQGAWVVSDTLARPELRAVVDRAVLIGHPSVATTHFHDDRDPGIVELNHRLDPITMPVAGPVEGMLDGVGKLVDRKDPSGLLDVLLGALHNPLRAVEMLHGTIRGWLFGSGGRPGMLVHDPHNYRDHIDTVIRVLSQPSVRR